VARANWKCLSKNKSRLTFWQSNVKLIRKLRWMGMEKAESTEGAGPPRRSANGQRVGSSARDGLAPVGSENFIQKDSRSPANQNMIAE
jgi:hypothetical protein